MGVMFFMAALFGISSASSITQASGCLPVSSVSSDQRQATLHLTDGTTQSFSLGSKHLHKVTVTASCGSVDYLVSTFSFGDPAFARVDPITAAARITQVVANSSMTIDLNNSAIAYAVALQGPPKQNEQAEVAMSIHSSDSLQSDGTESGRPTGQKWQVDVEGVPLFSFDPSTGPLSFDEGCKNRLPVFSGSASAGNGPAIGSALTVDSLIVHCETPFSLEGKIGLNIPNNKRFAFAFSSAFDGSSLALTPDSGTANISIGSPASATISVPSAAFISKNGAPSLRFDNAALKIPALHATSISTDGITLDGTQNVSISNLGLTFGSYSAVFPSAQCGVTGCNAPEGTFTLPPLANSEQLTLTVTFSGKSITCKPCGTISLGKQYAFSIPSLAIAPTNKQYFTVALGSAILTGPLLPDQGLQFENVTLSDEPGKEFSGSVKTSGTITFGDVITVTKPSVSLNQDGANPGLDVTFDGNAHLEDPKNTYNLTFTLLGAQAIIPFDGSSARFKFGKPKVNGMILGRSVKPCSGEATTNIDDDAENTAGEINACIQMHLTPNATLSNDLVTANVSFERDDKSKSYSLTAGHVSYTGDSNPIALRIGGGFIKIKALDLAYGADVQPAQHDDWFAVTDSAGTRTYLTDRCLPYLQGVMTISTEGLVSVGKATDVTSTMNVGPECFFGEAVGAVFMDAGPNLSAVVDKVAVAHIKQENSRDYDTIVAASGRIAISNYTLAFNKIGYETVSGKTRPYHDVAYGKTFWYSVGQNVGSIMTGLGALVYSIFHH